MELRNERRYKMFQGKHVLASFLIGCIFSSGIWASTRWFLPAIIVPTILLGIVIFVMFTVWIFDDEE
jgi:hypothetical protein